MKTRTGWRSRAVFAGVQTFRYKQSSLIAPCAMNSDVHGLRVSTMFCMQLAENVSALRTPGHAAAGCGARQRRLPMGGAANGTPLNAVTAGIDDAVPDSCPPAT